jgi:small subunit ribosomal protein S10
MLRNFKLKVSSHNLNSIKEIENCLNDVKSVNKKVIFLPKKIKTFTLLKSPHVNSKAKEHFKIEKYQRLIYLKTSLVVLKSLLERLPNDILLKIIELK